MYQDLGIPVYQMETTESHRIHRNKHCDICIHQQKNHMLNDLLWVLKIVTSRKGYA